MPDYLDVLVVDFDNTICPFREDLVTEGLVPGVIDSLTKLKKMGYRIIISSARNNIAYGGCTGVGHREMARFLTEHDVPYDSIDTGTTGKPVAYRYIDDKGVGCPLTPEGYVDWKKVYEMLKDGPPPQ
jgi:hypothetical protein